ncbi:MULTISPECIES: Gfo/Idh/MocA family protein [Mammaliicoccus]|uniref:Gfo/Idh/MocA family protein n=1 Tax=Mammaliicoccus TaxID=2803850 RepID=UPI000D1C4634|nr:MULTISPECIES: Gfo/Idh/MocA family oxidoreductase [Mammaliicoccus]HCN61386.1 gfo/Idh/MocA family oxidoreductase [Staphylococcus sp.]MBW0764872.1 Gfo/Idh/MocA family oxidoreductase [Mammaliicoccus fleurettii]MEB7779905.1 Gfo/Idh/MocA family oxidoreductase [Mammaliicoccus fleurettii]MEB7805932.1 Gfo/Idh/MocA family oxidoreductase [Mammaliicoccus fleurettii]MEB8068542.1 Gfo/Idh/MocA family oxidoreductase [Mammaliicoccus fleurettii]
MSLNVGIIGCGGIANGKHLPSLQKISEVNIVAFCDIEIEKAQVAAEQYGTNDAKVYENYKLLLENDDIDVIHVCTPNSSHKALTVASLDAGKHVMCEKPMAKTTEEAKEMIEAAKRNGKKLTIGYQNRFRPDSQYLRKATQRGDLGDIYYGKAQAIRRRAVPTWGVFLDEEKQGGGPLIDIGTHALDLTLWMMDNYEPESVMGSTFHKLGKKENAANAWGPWDPKKFTVEDSAFGFIKMKNGSTIILESSWALNSLEVDEAKCALSGTEGGADMKDGLRIHGEEFGSLYTTNVELENKGVDFYEGETVDEAEVEARSWIDSIVNDTEPVVKPEEAMVITQILEALYQSAKTGKAVYFD